MSILGSFFGRGFKASQCKTLLKLAIPRMKLLRNRREIQLKQMRKEIAKLLETGQEATARIRVEHIIREENMMAAQEILELYCELIAVRLPIIESQKECPLDLKEAISSICFAAPRCADLPELQQVQLQFAVKYGNEFIAAATELMPNCGVNRQIIELLSVRAPSPEKKLKLLKEIAVDHELDWDPAASETEFYKPHEDLLTGPAQFVSASTLPLPKEKHSEALNSATDLLPKDQVESDDSLSLDDLDFPEVPKVSVEAARNATSVTPEAVPRLQIHDESCTYSGFSTDLKPGSYLKDDEVLQERVSADKDNSCISLGAVEKKQFLPFTSPPAVSNVSPFPEPIASSSWEKSEVSVEHAAAETAKQGAAAGVNSQPSDSGTKCEGYVDPQDVLAATQFAADTARHTEFPAEICSPSILSGKKSEADVDLQDVRAAAQAATDTAERAEAAAESAKRAAAAARSAARLAQARISELTKDNSADVLDSRCDNPFHSNTSNHYDTTEPTLFDAPTVYEYDNIFRSDSAPHRDYSTSERLETSHISSFDKLKGEFDSSLPSNLELGDTTGSHQPKRLPSMEDETYLSYPNLFTSQNSRKESHSSENSRFHHDL